MTIDIDDYYPSLTENSLQMYPTKTAFPCCPKIISNNPLQDYISNLKEGQIFAKNNYYESVVIKTEINNNKNKLFVKCKSTDNKGKTCFAIFEITFDSGYYIHNYCTRHYSEQSINKILDYLLEKIPFDDNDPDLFEFEYM